MQILESLQEVCQHIGHELHYATYDGNAYMVFCSQYGQKSPNGGIYEYDTQLNLDDNKFTIIGKGNKERTNYLNKKTKDALIKYLKIRDNSHDNNKKHNNALFLTFYGYRMSQFTINKIVKRAYRKAELDENVYTVHTLRHTCATLLYRSGVNIKTIQELLGHVHIDTTEIYTHLDNQEVKDVMFEHPLAQFKMEDALAYCA